MTHPTAEELMDFLYGEIEPSRQAEVTSHLTACDACQARVATWGGVRRELAGWEPAETFRTPATAIPASRRSWPVVRWAAAAAVLIGTGFGLARLSARPAPVAAAAAPPADVSSLRAELARELRQGLRDELLGSLRSDLTAEQSKVASDEAGRREAFEQAVARALSELETRQLTQHTALRRDVETLALRAREELDQLAVAAQPVAEVRQQ